MKYTRASSVWLCVCVRAYGGDSSDDQPSIIISVLQTSTKELSNWCICCSMLTQCAGKRMNLMRILVDNFRMFSRKQWAHVLPHSRAINFSRIVWPIKTAGKHWTMKDHQSLIQSYSLFVLSQPTHCRRRQRPRTEFSPLQKMNFFFIRAIKNHLDSV